MTCCVNNNLLNLAINEYLDQVDYEYRKILKEELTYDLKFKEEFEERIYELSSMFGALIAKNYDTLSNFSTAFINRKETTNIHIVNMYQFYLDNMFEDMVQNYGNDRAIEILSGIKSIFDKTRLYYKLTDSLNQNIEKKINKLKI